MGRKHKNPSNRYEDYKHKGKKRRKSWKRRRIERIADRELEEHRIRWWATRRSIIACILIHILARKRKKSETLREYRLRVLNLELISIIIGLLILIFFLLSG